MTLLVRDEVDIIEENIKYHLSHGVDFIVATDNGSVDGTRDILLKYKKKGVLHLIDEPSQDYAQAVWVNRMGKIAYDTYKAKYIFHCDADEFWKARSGNLKHEIGSRRENVLKVDVVNVLIHDKGGSESFPEDARFAVVNPKEPVDFLEQSKKENMYFFKYPPKVIFRGYFDVTQGNHDIENGKKKGVGYSDDIIIYHYPLRSKEHFFQKVINGGSAYEKNKKLGKKVGWHWRRWFEAYKNGNLDQEYKKLILDEDDTDRLTKERFIREFDYNEDLLEK